MLCLAYQRIDFLKLFKMFKPKEIEFTFKDLEMLYGFSHRNGKTRELFPEELKTEQADNNIIQKYELFTMMTRPHDLSKPIVPMKESRKFTNDLSSRIRKSKHFFPQTVCLFNFLLQS